MNGKTKRRKLTAAEATEADARAEHFQRCWRYYWRVYEAAVRARERIEERKWREANPSLGTPPEER